MRGVLFDQNKGGLNFNLALTNNFDAASDPGATDDASKKYEVGSVWINTTGNKVWTCVDATDGAAVWVETQVSNPVAGVAAGYKIARGVHQQAAAQDTVVSGLATVVAVVVSFRDAPTLKQMFVAGSIGDQNGAPVAGSFYIKSYKPTASGDVTPVAATDFTDNINFDWIAVGT